MIRSHLIGVSVGPGVADRDPDLDGSAGAQLQLPGATIETVARTLLLLSEPATPQIDGC